MKKPIQHWQSGLCIITAIFTLAIAEAPRLIQWIQQNSKEVTKVAIAPSNLLAFDPLSTQTPTSTPTGETQWQLLMATKTPTT